MELDNSEKLNVIKSLSEVGRSAGGLLADFIKAMPEYSYANISATGGTTFSDIPSGQGGDLFIFKATNATIHKCLIYKINTSQSSASLSTIQVGFCPYNGGVSMASKWYNISLTAI